MTALMAALLGREVLNKEYETIRIRIAFHPVEERFEVTNPAIAKNKVWIPDIASIFSPDAKMLQITNQYATTNLGTDAMNATEAFLVEVMDVIAERFDKHAVLRGGMVLRVLVVSGLRTMWIMYLFHSHPRKILWTRFWQRFNASRVPKYPIASIPNAFGFPCREKMLRFRLRSRRRRKSKPAWCRTVTWLGPTGGRHGLFQCSTMPWPWRTRWRPGTNED